MSDTIEQTNDSHLVELAHVVSFTPDDLAANRQGTLSARQVTLLRRDLFRRSVPSLIGVSLLGVGLLAVAAFASADALPRLLSAGVGLLLAAYAVSEAWGAIRAVARDSDQVKAVSWRIDSKWKPARRLHMIEFQVEGRWFAADRALADCLRDGQRYRLYYYAGEWSYPSATVVTPRYPDESVGVRRHLGSYRVLSIEPI